MDPMTAIKPIDILLVEDNPGDVLLIQESLTSSKLANRLHVVEDGVEALKFLRREEKYSEAVRPDLIMLDLNLPRKDGREVLAEIKKDDTLKRIPVVVLTTSSAERDILKAYNLHANCYVTKPVVLEKFINVVKSVEDFWFVIVTRPSQ